MSNDAGPVNARRDVAQEEREHARFDAWLEVRSIDNDCERRLDQLDMFAPQGDLFEDAL